MLKYWSIISLVLILVAPSVLAISVSQSLSDDRIAFEDSARFEIVLQWPGPQSAFIFDKPLRPIIDKLRIGGFSSSISSTGSGPDEITTKTYRYTLIPTSSGLAVIEPLTIEYLSRSDSLPGQMVTEQMSLTVARPIPPVVADGRIPLWAWILIATGVVIGVGGVWWYRRRNKSQAPVVETPVERFLDNLSKVKAEAGSDVKKFQTGLHRILGEYLSDGCDVKAKGKSVDDLTTDLIASGLADGPARSIAGWYTRAEHDKFRPVKAGPGETIRLESEIRNCFGNL